MAAAPVQDNRNLAEVARDIALDLGKLASGLAQAGAQKPVTDKLHQMAQMIGEISTTLGNAPHVNGPAPGSGAPLGAPGPEAAPAPGGPPAPAAPQPQASPALAHPSLHEASAQLQAKLAAAHNAAQQQLAAHTAP